MHCKEKLWELSVAAGAQKTREAGNENNNGNRDEVRKVGKGVRAE